MMLEAGQSEARALAYIAEAKKLIPNKPIRYVMNTHPHADHTGGLPALVAEGATIITQKNNEEFFEKALNTPRTLLNDTLAKNPKKAKVEAVSEKKVYSDGTRTVEMYHISPVPHSNGLMVAYIPKEKVALPGRLLAACRGAAGERSRQGAGSGSREAQSGLRSLHQRARLRCSADQGGALEGRREIAAGLSEDQIGRDHDLGAAVGAGLELRLDVFVRQAVCGRLGRGVWRIGLLGELLFLGGRRGRFEHGRVIA